MEKTAVAKEVVFCLLDAVGNTPLLELAKLGHDARVVTVLPDRAER
ncbi:MAG: hypothetical protein GXP25_07635 [Planctomycetes bacterium]|nr:hypothetical protein [Planctomycetota bacterium]